MSPCHGDLPTEPSDRAEPARWVSFRELLQGGDIGGMGKMEASVLDLSVGAVPSTWEGSMLTVSPIQLRLAERSQGLERRRHE